MNGHNKSLVVSSAATTTPSVLASYTVANETELRPRDQFRQSLHTLVADDRLVNQEVILWLLELAGHPCEVVADGKKTLHALQSQTVDAILMDLGIPEMDGFEATSHIRRNEETNGTHVSIIAMTAHTVNGFREQCLRAGMDAYITKPIQPNELFSALRETTQSGLGFRRKNWNRLRRTEFTIGVSELSMVQRPTNRQF
jgi:CheY-like chemotaxis protein